MNPWYIIGASFILITEIVYIFVRKINPEDNWIEDKLLSLVASFFLTLTLASIVWGFYKVISEKMINLNELLWGAIIIFLIIGYFFINYLLDKFVLNIKK
jgi:hypothetical protein